MERIDFLGANSVGKSTLHTELVEGRDGDPAWLTRREAKRRVATEHLVDDGGPGQLLKAASCHLPRLGQTFVETFARRPAEQAFAEAEPRWHDFYEYCLQQVAARSPEATAGDSMPARDLQEATDRLVTSSNRAGGQSERAVPMRCVNLSWMFNRLTELCLLDRLDAKVVFDESLAHSTVGLLQEMPARTGIRNHFERMPRPVAVVHLTAPVDQIMDRIRQRHAEDETVLRHLDREENQLRRKTRRAVRIAEMGASTLEWRGVEVLSVDATRPVEEYVGEVEEFLEAV